MTAFVIALIVFQAALVALGIYMIRRGNWVGWIVAIGNLALIAFNYTVHFGSVS